MHSINGQLLKQMLLSAANNLYNHYPEIDALNVFPVPDGDTGMNMNLTLTSGAKEIANRNDDDAYTIANLFSRGLLMGARGNSGVITSQIFRGFAKALKDKKEINSIELSEAFSSGSEVAYKAVMRPVEGTILTVIRESSEALADHVNESHSLIEAMEYLVKEAKASLNRTPDLLPVLKEVGVVDSGGAGLVTIMEGMLSALRGDFIDKAVATSMAKRVIEDVDGKKGYYVEFKLHLGPAGTKKDFIERRYISILEAHGKEVKVTTEEDGVIDTKLISYAPGALLTYAQGFGEFSDIRISSEIATGEAPKQEEAKPVETKKKEPAKDYGIVSISAGSGIDDYFKEVGVDKIVSGGQTMNPSIEDIISAIRECNAKTVFVLPNNSNIIMAAVQAADVLVDEIDVRVISTKTIPQGIVAASSFNPDATPEENEESMKEAYANLKSGSVTYAIKDTTIDGFEVTKDYFMGILDKKIVVCEKNKFTSLFNLLEKMINEDSYLVTLFTGEDISKDELDLIRAKIEKKFPNVELDLRMGNQPVYSFLVGVE